jgi:hypothetical protein
VFVPRPRAVGELCTEAYSTESYIALAIWLQSRAADHHLLNSLHPVSFDVPKEAEEGVLRTGL